MNELARPRFSPGLAAGLVLTAVGILFVLDSFGVLYAGNVFDYWPVLLILPGLSSLFWPRKHADRFWGAILTGVGTLLLLRNLNVFWISFRHVWPAILVALGLYQVANRAYLRTDAATIQQQNVRFAMDRMAETIRDAGANYNTLGANNVAALAMP